jgi:hypothetical protein
MSGDLRSIIEGRCPTCGGVLERREDCGWCESCGFGHSLAGDTYTLHIKPHLPSSAVSGFTLRATDGMTFTAGDGGSAARMNT